MVSYICIIEMKHQKKKKYYGDVRDRSDMVLLNAFVKGLGKLFKYIARLFKKSPKT